MDRLKPYNTLPRLAPRFKVKPQLFLKCGQARAALAELKGAINIIPNPAVLINNIPLLETHSSNKIENIVTTQDSLFRFSVLNNIKDPATKEALRYRTALKNTINKPINTPLIKKICSIIKNTPMDLRSQPVRIVDGAGRTVYTPPDKRHIISQLLKNWQFFLQKLGVKSPITARKYLRKLVRLNILTEEKVGKQLLFVHNKYLKLLMSGNHKFEKY